MRNRRSASAARFTLTSDLGTGIALCDPFTLPDAEVFFFLKRLAEPLPDWPVARSLVLAKSVFKTGNSTNDGVPDLAAPLRELPRDLRFVGFTYTRQRSGYFVKR